MLCPRRHLLEVVDMGTITPDSSSGCSLPLSLLVSPFPPRFIGIVEGASRLHGEYAGQAET